MIARETCLIPAYLGIHAWNQNTSHGVFYFSHCRPSNGIRLHILIFLFLIISYMLDIDYAQWKVEADIYRGSSLSNCGYGNIHYPPLKPVPRNLHVRELEKEISGGEIEIDTQAQDPSGTNWAYWPTILAAQATIRQSANRHLLLSRETPPVATAPASLRLSASATFSPGPSPIKYQIYRGWWTWDLNIINTPPMISGQLAPTPSFPAYNFPCPACGRGSPVPGHQISI